MNVKINHTYIIYHSTTLAFFCECVALGEGGSSVLDPPSLDPAAAAPAAEAAAASSEASEEAAAKAGTNRGRDGCTSYLFSVRLRRGSWSSVYRDSCILGVGKNERWVEENNNGENEYEDGWKRIKKRKYAPLCAQSCSVPVRLWNIFGGFGHIWIEKRLRQ
jgi:hypothetical protein